MQEVFTSEAAAAAARARQSWQGAGEAAHESAFWQQISRRRSTPLLFSAACIVGGCALFAGAVHVNQHMCVTGELSSLWLCDKLSKLRSIRVVVYSEDKVVVNGG